MYKLLLCWRYLCTRYIALASIISVTLGVATMIVVNSVMSGFTSEMQNRIHGIISDVVFESRSLEGMPDPDGLEDKIRSVAGDQIDGMTATVVVPAMLNFQYGGGWMTRQVQLIGIDESTQGSVSDFSTYLQHPSNRKPSAPDLFKLRENGFDVRDHQAGSDSPVRIQMYEAGWGHRRDWVRVQEYQEHQRELLRKNKPAATAGPADPFTARQATDPFANRQPHEAVFDPAKEQHTGIILGIAMSSFRNHKGEDHFLTLPGDDIKLTFPTAGMPPKIVSDNFTVVDFYESKMSEYDASFAFVPIKKLQELRGMFDRSTGVRMVSSIAIKLKPGADGNQVRDKIRAAFPPELFAVSTWRDKQGALLAAVQMETAILNVLLFMIIAVAGFGILAIFYMIVVEKTRDIGILKSLGAPWRGVMGIFLTYGLLLGIVGSGAGMVAGLLIVRYINPIADFLGWITGRPVFPPEIYYFYKIPAVVSAQTVAWIVAGALAIAVLASVLPARRAASLHPVEALRYE
jgi:lipoprotein-releasing system permease protein